jgi:hypothetical protein
MAWSSSGGVLFGARHPVLAIVVFGIVMPVIITILTRLKFQFHELICILIGVIFAVVYWVIAYKLVLQYEL